MEPIQPEQLLGAIDSSSLFTPFRVNGIVLPNRFVMPGMQRGWCDNGAPLPQLATYYRRRVEGGVGLIITESLAVDHPSATQSAIFGRLTQRTLPEWHRCAQRVKEGGGHIFFQLWHEGAVRTVGGNGPYSPFPTLSPSGLVYEGKRNGRAATTKELAEIKAGFVRSAQMSQESGADGVEVHACHGYLLDQFLWAVTNRRADGYGGDEIRDRVRFPAEVVASIRAACGADFPISFRYSQWKEANYEACIVHSPEELRIMLNELRAAGVDIFHASTRRFWKPEWPGGDMNFAGWSKAVSGAPTITVGSVGLNIDVMETVFGQESESRVEQGVRELLRRFERNEFDLVSIGRSLIGDPDWVKKVREGRYADVRAFTRADLGKMESEGGLIEEAHDKTFPI